jgi:UDP-N-acetylmuramoylalanine--D-glutamate ligase
MAMTFSVAGQHVVVAGAGRSGEAAADLLLARGARVTLADTSGSLSRAEALRARGIDVEMGPHRAELFAHAALVVVSPGVPLQQAVLDAARAARVPIIGEIEMASRWLAGRVIAITGTKGKSTTTTLAARMLVEAGFETTAGGNLGVALSGQVAASRPGSLHVVEVSSFQLESTDTFHPWIAVLLNFSADHLDRHATLEAYGAAKARVFANQTSGDWAVVNADDPAALDLARSGRAERFDFALDSTLARGVTVEDGVIVRRDGGAAAPLLPLASVRLPGRHLLGDVLAAAAVGCLAGVPAEAMRRAVEGFAGLEHALELVGEHAGIRFVDDSKATNVVSARRAIESFDSGVVVILGGRFKGGDFTELRESIARRADAVVAIGEAAPRIHAALAGAAPVESAASMRDAVRQAFGRAREGGVVLLAPACASFDMFEDYAARGRAFRREVEALVADRTGIPGATGREV